LKSDAKGERLIESKRFTTAIEQLPPAEGVITFFDAEGMLGTFRSFASAIGAAQGQQGEEDSDGEPSEPAVVFKAINTLLADVSIIDNIASVEWTDGYRVYSDTLTTLRKGGKKSPLYKIITSGKPVKNFAKFVPKEADSFSVCAGIDLAKVYDYLTGFVEENVPGGRENIALFDELQAETLGIDIKKDVLELFTGASVIVKMGKGWVILLDVTDEKKVDIQIERLLTTTNNRLARENGLMVSRIDVGAKTEFRQISHPVMMMMGGMTPPVLGCTNGHLVLGSSAGIVRKCIQPAAGKHANITKRERWLAEALVPDGKITAISFTDETHTAQELQEAIAALSMGFGLVGMFAVDAPPELRKICSAVPPLLGKLSPVVEKLDFYKSSAAYCSFDGSRWYTREVQNYKTPSERPQPVEEDDDEEDEDDEGM